MKRRRRLEFDIPPNAGGAARRAAAAIVEHLQDVGGDFAGGGTVFYTPEEWARRGERVAPGSALVIVHDGPLATFFSYDYSDYDAIEGMREALQRAGFFSEQDSTWHSNVFPLQAGQRLGLSGADVGTDQHTTFTVMPGEEEDAGKWWVLLDAWDCDPNVDDGCVNYDGFNVGGVHDSVAEAVAEAIELAADDARHDDSTTVAVRLVRSPGAPPEHLRYLKTGAAAMRRPRRFGPPARQLQTPRDVRRRR